ncbi:MAG: HemK2/MTQ2 family protein methyltransferase [Candidatus Baldrarchaeia archaeon]
MKNSKMAFYGGYRFEIFNGVYEPAEDTYLLADSLQVEKGDFVLDLGTGCGILGIIAAKKAKKVVAIDISPIAVKCAKYNVKINGLAKNINIILGNLFQPLKKTKIFDLIVFNPPYLPKSPYDTNNWLSRAWDGGEKGRKIIDKFLEEFDNYLKHSGRLQLVQSSLSNPNLTIKKLKEKGFSIEVTARKKLPFFEEIKVLTAWR